MRELPADKRKVRDGSVLDRLKEAKYITSLDLKDGYWYFPLEAGTRQYTALTVPGKGLFQ